MQVRSVRVSQSWKVPKSENSASLVRKVLDASHLLGFPAIEFLTTDSPLGGGVSATARAVKKFPMLASLATGVTLPGAAETTPGLTTAGCPDDGILSTDLLLALLDGVPRSLPFHHVSVRMRWPAPEEVDLRIWDMWWINGRSRSLMVDWRAAVDGGASAPPVAGDGLAVLLAALGKPRSTSRQPLDADTAPVSAVADVVRRYRASLDGRVAALDLPHKFFSAVAVGTAAGPMKPVLVEAFGRRGFDCRGEHGAFVLRRRTPANHVVELSLDVGTWSHSFTGFLSVYVPGGRATLPLTPAPGLRRMAIDGAEGWKRIVDNLTVVVDDLESGFVVDVEEAAGPAPDWFEPGRA